MQPIDEEICPICYQTFTNEATLSCHHRFCLPCIINYYNSKRKEDPKGVIPCPYCRNVDKAFSKPLNKKIFSNYGSVITPDRFLSSEISERYKNAEDVSTAIIKFYDCFDKSCLLNLILINFEEADGLAADYFVSRILDYIDQLRKKMSGAEAKKKLISIHEKPLIFSEYCGIHTRIRSIDHNFCLFHDCLVLKKMD